MYEWTYVPSSRVYPFTCEALPIDEAVLDAIRRVDWQLLAHDEEW